jgi:predicted DNA binding CopG/RHH family protein
MQSSSGLTKSRKPLEIALTPIMQDIQKDFKNAKARKKRVTKLVRKDVRYTQRSVQRVKDIAVNHGLPIAYVIRQLLDSLLCGDLKKQILRGSGKIPRSEELIYE